MGEKNTQNTTAGSTIVAGAAVIKRMRDAMIVYSFLPIVFLAISSIIYNHFPPRDAELYSRVIYTVLSAGVIIYSVALLMMKRLMLGLVAKSGLWLVIAAFIIETGVWWLSNEPRLLVMSGAFYLMGLVLFVLGSWVGWLVKTVHVAFSAIMLVACCFLSEHPQAAVAVIALSIVAYPMLASSMSVRWASSEFLKLK